MKSFADRFSRAVAEAEPDRFTANIRKVQRKGRIFLDWLRNQRGATAVMPYSARAREGAPVAAPIAWEELDDYDSGARLQHPRCRRIAEARKVEAACRLGQSEAILAGCLAAPAQHSSRSSSFLPQPRPPSFSNGSSRLERVTITRDDWGIAHVHGKTDADAVFGMIYAQAEDDFPRIEANYLTALGRTAEAEGEKAIWQDLRARLYVSDRELKAHYAASPPWLRQLMDAWADGPQLSISPPTRRCSPRVLTRFEPWMALSFTEGSIGGDIERIDLGELQNFYAGQARRVASSPCRTANRAAPTASPSRRRSRRAAGSLLLINPHTSFFFRSEQQVTSDEGLNAYGAATWGQFFIYQGFNERAGWMHTSSGVDNVDEFAERVEQRGDGFCYRYGKRLPRRWQAAR